MSIKVALQEVCPPILWQGAKSVKRLLRVALRHRQTRKAAPDQQDLEMYWDAHMAEALEAWGEGNVWNEIQLLVANCRGRVLDIACGTGRTIEINSKFKNVELYGCDISDFLIGKAVERGIPAERLKVCDATSTDYDDHSFDYAYSIGSLEHFTNEGIIQFLQECKRIVRGVSFHMVPVSRKGDQGWITTSQSYHNNSVDWWLRKFNAVYGEVYPLDSVWQDDISVGKWFICHR